MRPPIVPHARRAAPAFMLMDLMMALAIGGATILSLAVAVGSFRRAERRMADSRAADRRLEQALLTLQTGGTLDPELRMERLGEGPAHRVWIRLSLRRGSVPAVPNQVALLGLVPADKAAGGAP
jgi:hypothetical protein